MELSKFNVMNLNTKLLKLCCIMLFLQVNNTANAQYNSSPAKG